MVFSLPKLIPNRVDGQLATVLVLPDRRRFTAKPGTKLSTLLESLGISDPDEIAIVINGSLVEEVDRVIGKDDEVIIIRQGIGG